MKIRVHRALNLFILMIKLDLLLVRVHVTGCEGHQNTSMQQFHKRTEGYLITKVLSRLGFNNRFMFALLSLCNSMTGMRVTEQ